MRLADLPPLLRDEPGLTRALGEPDARLAVVEVARPISIAALATLSNRRPLVVACPTGTMAAQLGDDLAQFLPAGELAVFPAWETLPFERVSPSVETMGQRLEVLWRLRDPERCPAVIVTGVRALLQRLGPDAVEIEPITVRPADVVDPDELVHRLAQFGYRREELVEHRGEFARRGAIIDVFPSTGDSPIRIDLWGDEVDRLTRFGVNDQRSIDDLADVCIFPARELIPSDEVRARASKLVGAEPWGREQWERLSEGALFDGMESWLPWLTESEQLLTDVLPANAKVVLVEPRRMRDRAIDLLAEEDDLAKALASTWERDPDKPFPRLHAEPDRILRGPRMGDLPSSEVKTRLGTASAPAPSPAASAACGRSTRRPSRPTRRWSRRRAGVRSPATAPALVHRLTQLLADGYRVVVAADGDGSAERLAALLRDHGLDLPVHDDGAGDLTKPGGHIVVAPLHMGATLPAAKLAIVAESDLTGRRRAHRRPRARKRDTSGFFEDLKPGNYVVHVQHGVGKYEGMVKRTIGGVERDYLLVAYKGGDKLYVPSDQIDVLRQYVGGEAPTLHRLGGSDFAKAKSRVRSAVREIAQELVVLYQKRVNAEGYAFGQDTPWQSRDGGRLPVRRDAGPARRHRRREGGHGAGLPDGPPRVRRRRLRQDRGRHPRRVQGDPGRQAGRRARPDDAAGDAARQHVRRPLRRLPDPRRDAEPLPDAGPGARRRHGHRVGRRRLRDRHPPPARRAGPLQGPRPARRRRGAALRRHPQGGDEAAQDERRRADADRDADPAHAGDEPRRDP